MKIRINKKNIFLALSGLSFAVFLIIFFLPQKSYFKTLDRPEENIDCSCFGIEYKYVPKEHRNTNSYIEMKKCSGFVYNCKALSKN